MDIRVLPRRAEDLIQQLERLEIPFTNHVHAPVFTVEEAQKLVHNIPGGHTKNLFLRDKKKTGLWLVTVLHDAKVDLKALKTLLGAQGSLSFCSADILLEKLGLLPGSVTPFGAWNDSNNEVTVVLDEKLFQFETINPHPLQNDMSLNITPQDLVTFLEFVGHAPVVVDVPVGD